jgi:hypothetical protein
MTFYRIRLILAAVAFVFALNAAEAGDPCKGPGAKSNPNCKGNVRRQSPPPRKSAQASRRAAPSSRRPATASSKINDYSGVKRVPPKKRDSTDGQGGSSRSAN